MKYFDTFFAREISNPHHAHFNNVLKQRTDIRRHGDLSAWLEIINKLHSTIPTTSKVLHTNTIQIGEKNALSKVESLQLRALLKKLAPWRKGPYQLFDIFIDTEWRSDWKWQRLIPYIEPLQNKSVLDVGCGNGYHSWRMLGEKAKYVMGIDPSPKFWVQYLAINHFIKQTQFDFLPIALEELPTPFTHFDTVFSMGVLYHRRDAAQHIRTLHQCLKPSGQLVLETLIIDESAQENINGELTPKARYAQMRNVWHIFTVNKLIQLLTQNGFSDVQCVDINTTNTKEQRATEWMAFHSLENFLLPDNPQRTIEGYPAPKRAILVAKKDN